MSDAMSEAKDSITAAIRIPFRLTPDEEQALQELEDKSDLIRSRAPLVMLANDRWTVGSREFKTTAATSLLPAAPDRPAR